MLPTSLVRMISIHAPLAGSDIRNTVFQQVISVISIHAPLAGSDWCTSCGPRRRTHFNPRSPCGERRRTFPAAGTSFYFNPRSPCGERRTVIRDQECRGKFQSTLPLRGATLNPGRLSCSTREFQSTLPLRGATKLRIITLRMSCISIHAPLAGSDHGLLARWRIIEHFNPRSPCGERPRLGCSSRRPSDISIHAPLAGSDCARAPSTILRR